MKQYVKENESPHFLRDIVIHQNGMTTCNPTEEMALAAGWHEYTPPVPLTGEEAERQFWMSADRDNEINLRIRERYSASQEFSLLRQRDVKIEEFKAYYDYCEECKAYVDAKLSMYSQRSTN